MSLGKIFGNITPKEFKFLVSEEASNLMYVKISHKVYGDVLAQIIDLEENQEINFEFLERKFTSYTFNFKIFE